MNLTLATTAVLACTAAGLAFALEPGGNPTPVLATAPVANTVTVSATGTTLVAASQMSMRAGIKGTAEVAEEAVTNFAQARTRALSGLEAAELSGFEVQAAGVQIDYLPEPDNANMNGMVVMSGNGMEAPSYGITCKEEFEVRFSPEGDANEQRDQVARAIDTAVDLGLKLKSNQNSNPYYYNPSQNTGLEATVKGVLEGAAKAEAEAAAQAAAMDRARTLASSLAELSGRSLGGVSSVTLSSLKMDWKGIGAGVEVAAALTVTFELQ